METKKVSKAADFLYGFFGWLAFNMILSIPLIRIGEITLAIIFIWLITLVIVAVLFIKKRIWANVGILLAVILNIGLWIVLFNYWGDFPQEWVYYIFLPILIGITNP